MMYVTIFALLFFAIEANVIEILVTENDNNKSLLRLGVFPLYQNYLKFRVKGCHDLDIILKSKPVYEVPFYYIIIGGWGNSKSRLAKYVDIAEIIIDDKDFVALDCNDFKDFWISWDKGKFLVGRGNTLDTDIFLSYNEPCPFKILDIEAAVSWNAKNTWLIDTAQFIQEPVLINKRKREAMVKLTTCPTFRVLSTVTSVSRIGCVSMCLSTAECESVQFDDNTNACKLESTILDTVDESMRYKLMILQ